MPVFNLQTEFSKFLYSNGLNKTTVRNYIADLNKFIHWFESIFGKSFTPEILHPAHYDLYKEFLDKSNIPISNKNRYLASVKKFIKWSKPDQYDHFFLQP